MSLSHQLVAASYLPMRSVRAVERACGREANQLRVLAYHDSAAEDLGRLAEQLRWLSRSWTFVSPERFGAMVYGDEPTHGRNLLVTFDDGFHSNRAAAEKVLKPMGIQGLFFIISEFADKTDLAEARRFIADRIQPGSETADLPSHWRNMTWADLAALLEQGHAIGGHTRTHARLSRVSDELDLERELVGSAEVLERHLGTRVEHFAWPFGDLMSISESALRIARRRYRFVHSGLRGNNRRGVSPFALRRDASALQDAASCYRVFPNQLLGAFLEGVGDLRYAKSRRQLDAWTAAAGEPTGSRC